MWNSPWKYSIVRFLLFIWYFWTGFKSLNISFLERILQKAHFWLFLIGKANCNTLDHFNGNTWLCLTVYFVHVVKVPLHFCICCSGFHAECCMGCCIQVRGTELPLMVAIKEEDSLHSCDITANLHHATWISQNPMTTLFLLFIQYTTYDPTICTLSPLRLKKKSHYAK